MAHTNGNGERLSTLSATFIEALYAEFLRDPASVDPQWRRYFESLAGRDHEFAAHPRLGPTFRPPGLFSAMGGGAAAARRETSIAVLQDRLDQLIRAYRVRGHMLAQLDPLGTPRPPVAELSPEFHGFTESHMELPFSVDTIPGGGVLTLREIVSRLRNTYCRSIGAQFMHIDDSAVRQWLQRRMEGSENRLKLTRDEQIRILTRLTDAVMFEEFIQKKFLGAKSFSLEGGESLIPLLELAIERAGEHGLDEIVLAMAHRGRLNVLANILGKSPRDIFREFEDADPELSLGRGDVKYHLGYSSEWKTMAGRKVHLSLCFNPSHLEFVNPVALGRMRAKQDRVGDRTGGRGMALLIHGDAAFAGQGVVQETLNLSQLAGYFTGGALHVVVNNQIGFTTNPSDSRSSTYATDVAKMLQSPIFHVNGEDPEAVAQVVRLAMDFRNEFHRDVVIDMYCYRRRGHNEGDEPAFTQPLMYQRIQERPSVREGYLEHLLELNGVTRADADEIALKRRQVLEAELSAARSPQYQPRVDQLASIWRGYVGGPEARVREVETGIARDQLVAILGSLTSIPQGFHLHPKLERVFEARRKMAGGERPLDWAAGEALALASLALDQVRVRLTGQDTGRGTFSHRHAVLHDHETGDRHQPLQHLSRSQKPVEIYDSPLSEVAPLGFEYGYTLDYPDCLVLWEAQFGDFVNVAQVIIDQFIASGEEKWHRLSSLVLLLPHGFEGQGPEHSHARLERFLALAADDNIQVANPTTPAQYFHLLRRQALRKWAKPLVVMTPKSLLRHPRAVSPLEDFSRGTFRRVLPDPEVGGRGPVDRILLCSGKLFYDLVASREQQKRDRVAILRVEQLYPITEEVLGAALAPYAADAPVVWVQEEPENMGALRFLHARFGHQLGNHPFTSLSRPASASPATGSHASHDLEQKELIEQALG